VNENDEKEVREAVVIVVIHLAALESLWEDFQSSEGMTARLWSMYIGMVLILKRFIHAQRAGQQRQQLEEAEKMLPYTMSSEHSKYMSCQPIYLDEMKNLSESAPDVYQTFLGGEFSVHVTEEFGRTWL